VTPTSEASPHELPIADSLIAKYFVQTSCLNNTVAFQLLVQHAEEGNHLAMGYIALIYYYGTCSIAEKDTSKSDSYAARAVPWLKARMVHNNENAQNVLGSFYLIGFGGKIPDRVQAVQCFTLGACYCTV
jgi:TPR repeat protein